MRKSKLIGRSKWVLLVVGGLVSLALRTAVIAHNNPAPTAELYGDFIAVYQPTTFDYRLNDVDVPGAYPDPPVWDTIGNLRSISHSSNLAATTDISVIGNQMILMS
ncbi:MAG: hypothetical protein NZT92_06685 [Abditibacteriales bacterium]|nr:hypothetical protein [Abditibacteriales bacterium]MDW8365632.1 hypothetical protein [Abditibacteriales bacterium]